MNNQTKRNIKNTAKTGGKYALSAVKFAGKTALSATEITAKGINKVMSSPKNRRILAKAGTIAASVAFAGPAISLAAMNYLVNNIALDKSVTPLQALENTFNMSTHVLKDVLDMVSEPTAAVAKEVGKLAHKGKDALDR